MGDSTEPTEPTEISRREMAKSDPGVTEQIAKYAGALVKRYFRAEVRGLDNFPAVGPARSPITRAAC